MEQMIQEVLQAYALGGQVTEIVRYGEGHINDTFRLTVHTVPQPTYYILQRLSNAAFKQPALLMENMMSVTAYLQEKIAANGGDVSREAIAVVSTVEGKPYYIDRENRCWRMTHFIANSVCLQKVETPEQFYDSAKAFGNFQWMLRDFPANTLHETIPRFHDTVNRLANFKKALQEDKLGRAANCEKEIAFILERESDCDVCLSALRAGKLPLRVTHNDTKLNNILFDETTGQALCVIDLDTVMPGLSINDFGDSIRFGANHAAEDEPDLSKVNFDLDLYDIYTKGFLEGAKGALTQSEREYLPWGAKLMTLECGIRFLTDYLEGDQYFHIQREGQNLDRARTQFKLVADMEACWSDMEAIVKKYN